MSIRVMFVEDYSGDETDNKLVKKGDIIDINQVWFERLIADKRAVVMPDLKPRKSKIKVEVKPEPVEDEDEIYYEAIRKMDSGE